MARPSKKAISKAQEASKALDRIFAEVDPQIIIVGFLGGTAAAGGIVPPFTRLLSIVTSVTDTSADYQRLFEIGNVFAYGPGGLIPGLFRLYIGEQQREGMSYEDASSPARYALFCSGALEAMLMYKAFSNPEIMKSVLALPGDVLKGIGEIVPG